MFLLSDANHQYCQSRTLSNEPSQELVQEPAPNTPSDTSSKAQPSHLPSNAERASKAQETIDVGKLLVAPQTPLLRQLKKMLSTLQLHPDITVTEAKVNPPAPQYQIFQAISYARGTLPPGVEEFYSQVGSIDVEWAYTDPKAPNTNLPLTGSIHILPITEVFGDNWRDITWFPLPEDLQPHPDDAWRFTYRNVVPFDLFVPEACMCFIQEEGQTPENCVAFHYFGEELYRTRYTFSEYIERLLASYGFWYWGETICEECQDMPAVLSFRDNMPIIFKGYDHELFTP